MSNGLKYHINFGAVSMPVRVEAAARAETISFNQMTLSGARVKQKLVDANNGEEVFRSDIRKAFEYEKGKFVTMDPSDFERITPESEKVVVIEEFVPIASVNPIHFEASFYVTPEDAGIRGYAILYGALKNTGKAGVAKATMHGREHLVLITAGSTGLVLYKLYYLNEVRGLREFRADLDSLTEREKTMGGLLVDMMTVDRFEPSKYEDEYSAKLRALIAAKVDGMDLDQFKPAAAPKQPDIMAAIEATLAALKGKQEHGSVIPKYVEMTATLPRMPESLLDSIVYQMDAKAAG